MIRRRIVDTRWGQMHVRSSPGEGDPLVALHMSPLSSRMWLPLMERLARPVVAPDRLGFGCSDPPPQALTMEDYAGATADALDAIGVEQFDVLGEHTGSVEAVALAHLLGARIGIVGLVSIPAYTDDERRRRLAKRGAPPAEPDEAGSHLLALWQRRLAYRSPPYDFGLLHRITVEELTSAGPHLAYRAVFSYPMRERLSALPHPLFVFAPNDDLAQQTSRAREWLPANATYVDLPHLGLDIFELAADEMAELVSEYLGRGGSR